MRIDFHSRWLRLLVEIPASLPVVGRYRVLPPRLDGQVRRFMQRQITGRMQQEGKEKVSG